MDAAVACQWLLWLCRHYVHDRVQIDLTEEGGVLKALSITRTPTFTNLNVTPVLPASYSYSQFGKGFVSPLRTFQFIVRSRTQLHKGEIRKRGVIGLS